MLLASIANFESALNVCREAIGHGTVLRGADLLNIIQCLQQFADLAAIVKDKAAFLADRPLGIRMLITTSLNGGCPDCLLKAPQTNIIPNYQTDGEGGL